MSKSPADQLFAHYCAMLNDQGVDWQEVDERLLMLSGESEHGDCDGFLSVADLTASDGDTELDAVLLQVAYAFPAPFDGVEKNERAAVFELMAHLAPDLSLGSFEIDPDDNRLRYRMSTLWPAGPVPKPLMYGPLVQGLEVIDTYAPVFSDVLGGVDPAHAYVAMVLAEFAEEGGRPDEAERVRLLGIIELATGRYKARSDQDRLDALAELVRDLTAA